jgi:hypothetical protein
VKNLAILLLLVLAATSLSAQVFVETFSYPNGPSVPGWTAASGTWAINNGRLYGSGSGWRYINKNGLTAKDCVMDGEYFLIGSATQFGGLTARHPGGSSTTNLVMCKVQNNSTPGPKTALNRCYIYEQPGGSVYKDIPNPRPTSAFARMIILDTNAWMLVDANKDGIFEMMVGPRALTSVHGSGLCGMNSYGACEMDNFKFYNAVILGASANPMPQPGASLKFDLRGTAALGYQAASSFGRAGIPIGGGKAVPLSGDPLFFLTVTNAIPVLFANYAGYLNTNGDGSVKVNLPNAPALVGITIFTAFVTFDRNGIQEISNDHQVTIVP